MNARRWIRLAAAWGLTALLLSAYVHLAYAVESSFWRTLGRQLFSAALFIPLSGFAISAHEALDRSGRGRATRLAGLLAIGLGFAAAYTAGFALLRDRWELRVFLESVIVGGLVLAIARWIRDRRELAERQRQALELERDLERARLSALESQVQPHFLFNTLHAIGITCASDAPRARQMIDRLAAILRGSLDRKLGSLVTLEDELGRVEAYVSLMKLRFEEDLEVGIEIVDEPEPEGSLRTCLVPSYGIQTLVENAMKHAVESQIGVGRIWVRARREQRALWIEVEDNGPGFDFDGKDEDRPAGTASENAGLRLGLVNLQSRLTSQFSGAAALEVTKGAAGGALVRIRLPTQRGTEVDASVGDEA
jgi:sensor histidine kinase YesM